MKAAAAERKKRGFNVLLERRVAALAILVVTVLSLPGNGAYAGADSTGKEDAARSPLHLGVVLYDRQWSWGVRRGMDAAAAESPGVRLSVKYHPHDIIEEGRIIREYIAERVDALLLIPQDAEATVTAIKAAYDAGIPVLCVGSCLNEEDTRQYVTAIYESDNKLLGYRTGLQLVQWLAERMPDQIVNIGILHCDRFPACVQRSTAFRAALDDSGLRWNEIAYREGYIAEGDLSTAVAEEVLRTFPETHVLWSANEGGTVGAVRAVRNLGLEGKVYVFGTDIHGPLAEMLLSDDQILQAVTGQEPSENGYQAILGAIAVVRGELGNHYRVIDPPFYPRTDRERIESFLEELEAQQR